MGPEGLGRHHESLPDGSSALQPQMVISPAEFRNLERWAAFHEAVEQLPEADRELIELGYYEGLKTDEMARLLGVEEWTVRRRWNRAIRKLIAALGDEIPA
jgi:RNA polymerase sigma-70 factor (ECF subfamily)